MCALAGIVVAPRIGSGGTGPLSATTIVHSVDRSATIWRLKRFPSIAELAGTVTPPTEPP